MNNPLFEFEDLECFPDTIRKGMVDYLSFFLRKTDYYKPVIPLITEYLYYEDTQQIVNLCSVVATLYYKYKKTLSFPH